MPKWEPEKIRLGVSACLLGEAVRYDGGHKRDAFVVETLGPFVEWVPVCPEVELGLGVPRPAIRRGPVPLVMPITLLRQHVRRLQLAYLAEQVYLRPIPAS
jgi:uncharacterized protein YbbK (DUF523 family)